MRDKTMPTLCAAPGCPRTATIVHAGLPYCGHHALEQLEHWHRPLRDAAAAPVARPAAARLAVDA